MEEYHRRQQEFAAIARMELAAADEMDRASANWKEINRRYVEAKRDFAKWLSDTAGLSSQRAPSAAMAEPFDPTKVIEGGSYADPPVNDNQGWAEETDGDAAR